MPIPKRENAPKKTIKKTTRKQSVWYYNDNASHSNNKEKSTWWCLKIWLIILWIYFVLVVIGAIVNNNSSNKSANNYNTTNSNTNSYEKDWKCKWSDWYRYRKPAHAYCDWWETPLWWKCISWYKAKSLGDITSINDSWYCKANCENFSCPSINTCSEENNKIPKSVNRYSSVDVQLYNLYVEIYNKCLSEKCTCW